jgi:hypothetical protein
MSALSQELVASIIVGVVIPLVLKVIQHFFPWLTIDYKGSGTTPSTPTENPPAEQTRTERAPEDVDQ